MMGAGCPLASTKGEKATGDTMLNIALAAFPHFAYIVFYSQQLRWRNGETKGQKSPPAQVKTSSKFRAFRGRKGML